MRVLAAIFVLALVALIWALLAIVHHVRRSRRRQRRLREEEDSPSNDASLSAQDTAPPDENEVTFKEQDPSKENNSSLHRSHAASWNANGSASSDGFAAVRSAAAMPSRLRWANIGTASTYAPAAADDELSDWERNLLRTLGSDDTPSEAETPLLEHAVLTQDAVEPLVAAAPAEDASDLVRADEAPADSETELTHVEAETEVVTVHAETTGPAANFEEIPQAEHFVAASEPEAGAEWIGEASPTLASEEHEWIEGTPAQTESTAIESAAASSEDEVPLIAATTTSDEFLADDTQIPQHEDAIALTEDHALQGMASDASPAGEEILSDTTEIPQPEAAMATTGDHAEPGMAFDASPAAEFIHPEAAAEHPVDPPLPEILRFEHELLLAAEASEASAPEAECAPLISEGIAPVADEPLPIAEQFAPSPDAMTPALHENEQLATTAPDAEAGPALDYPIASEPLLPGVMRPFPVARPVAFQIEPDEQLAAFWPAFRATIPAPHAAPPQTAGQALAAVYAPGFETMPDGLPAINRALPSETHKMPVGASSPRLSRSISGRHVVAPLRRPDLSIYFSRGAGDLSDPLPARSRTREGVAAGLRRS